MKKVQRYRSLFADGRVEIMLYTERLHFFRRLKLRAVQHVLFYSPPHYAQFYPELLNLLEGTDVNCVVQFGKYVFSDDSCKHSFMRCRIDALELERIVGTSRAQKMLQGDKQTYLFC